MKFITVTGITLQFDEVTPTMSKETQAETTVMLINEILAERFPNTQPQIQLTAASEITVIQPEFNDEVSECIKNELHLTDCDNDGFCNHCGHQ